MALRVVLFCVVVLGCAVLTTGCSVKPSPAPSERTAIAQIPEMKQVEIPVLERAIKPRISVIEHDGTKVVTLDKEGMARLIDLYQHDGYATTTANNAVDVARAAITERNRLLALAKAEELEGNRLRAELHDVKDATKDERFWNSVELNVTRALLALALLAGI